MTETLINGKWKLNLPENRKEFFDLNPKWEWQRLDAMYATIKKGDQVLDIGSEFGDLSALFSMWSERQIVLIEGAEGYWPYVRDIFMANHLLQPFCINAMAGKEIRGNLNLEIPEVEPKDGFVHLDERDDIPIVTIDSLEFTKLDVVTIDTEGSELEIIKGAERTLKELKPTVFISVHPVFMRERYGDTPSDLDTYMKNLGYSATHLGTDHEEHWMYE